VTYRSAPPPLGAQTQEVLAEFLAMPASQIDELRAKGII
jgi:crotonobetainyl-CoA:carnitine CoA-transferase CaiB-like acyl-CoA transferase